jgi:hypothetical protein
MIPRFTLRGTVTEDQEHGQYVAAAEFNAAMQTALAAFRELERVESGESTADNSKSTVSFLATLLSPGVQAELARMLREQ